MKCHLVTDSQARKTLVVVVLSLTYDYKTFMEEGNVHSQMHMFRIKLAIIYLSNLETTHLILITALDSVQLETGEKYTNTISQ